MGKFPTGHFTSSQVRGMMLLWRRGCHGDRSHRVQTRIEDLSDEALFCAYNAMADIRGIPQMKPGHRRDILLAGVEAIIEMVAMYNSVTIAEDGTVTAEPLPKPSTSRIEHTPSEARVSPGIARMRARLGTEGTDQLRRQVVADGDASLQAAAARPVAPAEELGWVDGSDPSGDAAMASAAAAGGPGDPEGAARHAASVAESIALKELSTVELNKRLGKEMDPLKRDVLKAAMKIAAAREAGETKTATTAPAPRRSPEPGKKATAFAATDVIRLKVAGGHNPKRAGAAKRFALYTDGMTVADYTAALGDEAAKAQRDLAWDSSQGWITVGEA